MYKLNLEKAEESDIKLTTSAGSQKKHEDSRKTSTSASLTMLKLLMMWLTTNCGKFKRWDYQTILPASWETCMQVRTGHGTTDWFNGSKLGKDYIKAVYCHFIYLTLCRVRHVKCRAGRITRWNQDCQEKEQ